MPTARAVARGRLRAHGLLKGRHLGIDSSVMEANASLSGLVQRNTEKSYWITSKSWPERPGVDQMIPPPGPVLPQS